MNEKEFKEKSERLEQIGNLLNKLPAEVRGEAFQLLKSYIGENHIATTKLKDNKIGDDDPASTEGEFFAKFDQAKPAENVKLIAGYFYGQYGVEPFTVDEIKQKADGIGITIPGRIDMTLLQSKDKGRKLFMKLAPGKFRPTVNGEVYFKDTYNIRKGKKVRHEGKE